MHRSKEYEEAAERFLEAAELSKSNNQAYYFVRAAETFRDLGQYESGKKAVQSALLFASGDLRREATSVLYELLRRGGEVYPAFATAELALQDNPQLSLRFNLALDYRREKMNELALQHFKFLNEQNDDDYSSLHNLALLCADCKLPIYAAERYKRAFAMGESLSAVNLAYMHLDSGAADQARALIQEAMKMENHVPKVEKCLSDIIQRREDEESKEAELLTTASDNREFLVVMGRGLRSELAVVTGSWKFPFGEMVLTSSSGEVTGTVDLKRERSGLESLFISRTDQGVDRIDRYTLKGNLTGAVCKFDLTVVDASPPDPLAIGLYPIPLGSAVTTHSGFIVFAPGGRSAVYMELVDNKLGKQETISKVS